MVAIAICEVSPHEKGKLTGRFADQSNHLTHYHTSDLISGTVKCS